MSLSRSQTILLSAGVLFLCASGVALASQWGTASQLAERRAEVTRLSQLTVTLDGQMDATAAAQAQASSRLQMRARVNQYLTLVIESRGQEIRQLKKELHNLG